MQQTAIKNTARLKRTSARQRGVTLLLAILVLSAIVAISFSFASIILIEIKASGDEQRTEPAYYGVQGLVEEVIFKIKRGITNDLLANFDFGTCNPSDPNALTSLASGTGAQITTTNQVALASCIGNRNPQATVNTIVLATSDTLLNTRNVYSLYDPDSPYTNTYGGNPSAYSSIQFKYLAGDPGGTIDIYACLSDQDCSTVTDSISAAQPIKIYNPSGSSACTPSIGLCPDKAYQFYLVNRNHTNNVQVQIYSRGPDPKNNPSNPTLVKDKGLPLFGQSVVDVSASFSGLTRKYEVSIPNE